MNRVALVTGGGRGLGRATAHRLAEGGFDVAIHCRESVDEAKELSETLKRKFQIEAQHYQADITDSEQVKALVSGVVADFGAIDVLVNNAGIRDDALFLLQSTDAMWHVMHTNFGSVVNCSKAVLPQMLLQRSGTIINISSISGRRGVAGQTAYSSSKAAIEGFSRSLTKEVGSRGISVVCVAPGLLSTDMAHGLPQDIVDRYIAATPSRRLGTSDEVAEVIYSLSTVSGILCQGQVIVMDGGTTA